MANPQSRPWEGVTVGDAGAYSDAQWQQTWATMVGTGANAANRGVQRGVDDELAVVAESPASTNVTVSPGAALVQGIWFYDDSDTTVAIAANASGNTRIDVVVLEADYNAQTVRVALVQGTPAAGVPALTQSAGVIWQIPLAYITLTSGFTSIDDDDITDLREYTNIPSVVGVDVTNSSGGTLEYGTLAIWLAAGGAAINTTTVAGSFNVAGVLESRVTSGATGRILIQGIVSLLCDEAVAVGDALESSTTAGQAQRCVANGSPFGRVLVANSGAGTRCLALINIPAVSGTMVTGTYTGNGAATQAITGLGFQPRTITIYPAADGAFTGGDFFWKTNRDGVFTKLTNNYDADHIISLDSDGFTVGDGTGSVGNTVNVSARPYTYIAWR